MWKITYSLRLIRFSVVIKYNLSLPSAYIVRCVSEHCAYTTFWQHTQISIPLKIYTYAQLHKHSVIFRSLDSRFLLLLFLLALLYFIKLNWQSHFEHNKSNRILQELLYSIFHHDVLLLAELIHCKRWIDLQAKWKNTFHTDTEFLVTSQIHFYVTYIRIDNTNYDLHVKRFQSSYRYFFLKRQFM